jgi:hypothetical protein
LEESAELPLTGDITVVLYGCGGNGEPDGNRKMTTTVAEHNAYRFADTYQIVKAEFDDCVGTEHNEQEAKALVAYLNNRHGGGYKLVRNSPDDIRAAKVFGKSPIPMACRQDAFEEAGIWTKKRNR